jgi:hypothetical protein
LKLIGSKIFRNPFILSFPVCPTTTNQSSVVDTNVPNRLGIPLFKGLAQMYRNAFELRAVIFFLLVHRECATPLEPIATQSKLRKKWNQIEHFNI